MIGGDSKFVLTCTHTHTCSHTHTHTHTQLMSQNGKEIERSYILAKWGSRSRKKENTRSLEWSSWYFRRCRQLGTFDGLVLQEKFVFICTHIHKFPHTHTQLISRNEKEIEITHTLAKWGSESRKRSKDLTTSRSKCFHRCRHMAVVRTRTPWSRARRAAPAIKKPTHPPFPA